MIHKIKEQVTMVKTEDATTRVQLCNDGKYRWVHEVSLYKNPVILILLLKIFFWVCVGIWAFSILLRGCDSIDSKDFLDMAWGDTKMFMIITAGAMVLCLISYYIYALIMGGKYCVLFEMNEKGVLHKQMPKQAKKAELIGAITALAGVMSRNITTTAVGLNAAGRTEMYSTFASVKTVESLPKRNTIKVNETLNHNQVYVSAADYDFVLRYILDHVPLKARDKFMGKNACPPPLPS